MEENKNPLKNVHIVIRHSPLPLKILLGVLVVLSMATLGTLRLVHNNIQAEIRNLESQAAAVEYEDTRLDQRMEDPTSFENIRNIAKEELGLVDPDTVLFDPQ